jgi:FkbM family methyltransferase
VNLLLGIHIYYSLFGIRGVLLAAKARAFNRSVVVTVNVPHLRHPIHLRLRTSDVTVFRSVILDKEYEWPLAKSPKLIVDAGANIGLTSVFYANTYPEAKIIAIEPEPSNYNMLVKNTAKYHNISPIRAALWNCNGRVHIIDGGIGGWSFQVEKANVGASNTESPGLAIALTLDQLMSDFKIDQLDLLKVDIEGSEKEVFENSVGWINRVGVIVIELHDRLKAGCSNAVEQATKNWGTKFRRSETTFLLRTEYVVEAGREASSPAESQPDIAAIRPYSRIISAETIVTSPSTSSRGE